MRKAFRHSGVLMMVAVVALGLLGAAYTLWFEDLQIQSQVSTGTFDADVSLHSWDGDSYEVPPGDNVLDNGFGRPVVLICSEPITGTGTNSAKYVYNNQGLYGCTFGDFPAEKQDAETTCEGFVGTYGTDLVNANDVVDQNKLTLAITKAFPFAGCQFRIDIHNSGSVPMHVNIVDAEYAICDLGTTVIDPQDCDYIFVLPDDDKPAISNIFANCSLDDVDLTGQLQDGEDPLQLHAGDEAVCDLTVLLDQGADLENKTILASVTYRAYQWNEVIN